MLLQHSEDGGTGPIPKKSVRDFEEKNETCVMFIDEGGGVRVPEKNQWRCETYFYEALG